MKIDTKLILIISIFSNCSYVLAQDSSNVKASEAFKQAVQEYASRSRDEKKLQYGMYELLRLAEAADTSAKSNQEFKDQLRIDKALKADSEDRVRIFVHLRSIPDRNEVIQFMQSNDGIVEEEYPDFPYVLCKIHPKKLRALASMSSVRDVKKNAEGFTRTISR